VEDQRSAGEQDQAHDPHPAHPAGVKQRRLVGEQQEKQHHKIKLRLEGEQFKDESRLEGKIKVSQPARQAGPQKGDRKKDDEDKLEPQVTG
jgi:hypothetical protein